MLRRIIDLLLTSLLMLTATSVWAGDFRKHTWGKNEAAIRAMEKAVPLTEAVPTKGLKALVYEDEVAGLNTFVVYILAYDQLVHMKYLFAQRYSDGDLFLVDFAHIEEILREKHGEPCEAGQLWREGVEEDDSDLFAAIAIGDMALLARWETGDSHFLHVIHGENFQISHEVDYISKELGGLEAELVEKAQQEEER